MSHKNGVMRKVITSTEISTPLGLMFACVVESGVCLLEFADSDKLEDRMDRLKRLEKMPIVNGRHPVLTLLRKELKVYFKQPDCVFSVPLQLSGTEFQQSVWSLLQNTRAGETITYGGLAILVGRDRAIRAVAAANGANPVSILVPCHRVIAINGALTGYGGGIERKQWLLKHENPGSEISGKKKVRKRDRILGEKTVIMD